MIGILTISIPAAERKAGTAFPWRDVARALYRRILMLRPRDVICGGG